LITVTEKVIYQLRERILDGKYTPGQHLHEEALADDLKVSRTPIRDALKVLASEDLLVYAPNRGYFVRDVDLADVLDAYDVRGTLEGMACRIVAEQGLPDGAREQLETLIERGEKIFRSPRWGEREQAAWRTLNTDFHFALVEASRNRHLDPLLRQIRRLPRMFDARLDPETGFFQKVYTRDQRLRSHREHVEIVEALLSRQGARAEALMRDHVYRNREVLRQGLQVDSADKGEKPDKNAERPAPSKAPAPSKTKVPVAAHAGSRRAAVNGRTSD
jgi:GntR family transcriptional regulator of vanillate catabolism